jgi:hydrogenase maturation protein HypF
MNHLLLPGGDKAILNPLRIAYAALLLDKERIPDTVFSGMRAEEKQAIGEMVLSGVNCPKTSSIGRLFDAVSALLGVCTKRTYEGQPAIELEGVADKSDFSAYPVLASDETDSIIINTQSILKHVVKDIYDQVAIKTIAARFHTTLARASAMAALKASQQCGCKTVCLSGGVFQNVLFIERLLPMLREYSLIPIIHKRIPPNDENISYGQLVIAASLKALN